MHEDDVPVSHDTLWGAEQFSIEIFGSVEPKYLRKTFYLLEKRLIAARKIGNQWTGSRREVRRQFNGTDAA
jgi:hypothetical protein